jgi:D-sedoheptulose 7-phosphate isomerase
VESAFSAYMHEAAGNLQRSASPDLDARMAKAVAVIADALDSRLPLLICGNGGSHADAQHIAGELASRFLIERGGLPAIALGTNTATLTAWSNDYEFESCFAREVEAYGRPGGVVLGISTSGNSRNIIKAFEMARSLKMTVIALTGQGGGRLAQLTDILLDVPETRVPRTQEIHICLYHYLCAEVESVCARRVPPNSKEFVL